MTSQIPMRYIEFLGRAEEGIKERDFRGFSKRRVYSQFGLRPKFLVNSHWYLLHQASSLINKRHAHPYF
jgi:hypothetical protein